MCRNGAEENKIDCFAKNDQRICNAHRFVNQLQIGGIAGKKFEET
jgi:hypothetical protein